MAKCSPGSWVTLKGTTVAAVPTLRGKVLKDRLVEFEIRDRSNNLVFKGKLQDRVVKSTKTGKLCFYHFIRETQSGLPGSIASVRRTNFAGFTTDLEFSLDGLGNIGPTGANRNTGGDMVNFIFTPGKAEHPEWLDRPIHSGEESRLFYVDTDATAYELNGTTTIYGVDGSKTVISTFSPMK